MNKCEFCNKEFKREKTFISHMCETKRRWNSRDVRYVQLGFMAYKRFFQKTSLKNKTDKDYIKFIKSKIYLAFIRFGQHLININSEKPELFIDFLIKHSIPLDDWCKDKTFELWTRERYKKEQPSDAVNRCLKLMQEWEIKTGDNWKNFFRHIQPALAIHWIRMGKISPWVIYTASSSKDLVEKMNEEELDILNDYIRPSYWKPKLIKEKKEVERIKSVFKEIGI